MRATRGREAFVLVWVGLAALLSSLAFGLVRTAAADARIAAGGVGRFVDAIDWIEWGTPGELLSGAGTTTRSSTTTVGGVDFVLTCSLSNFTISPVTAYRPGFWRGDAMDELYNVGGSGDANTLVNAVKVSGNFATFDFACSATLGGQPFPLEGLVFGDAEQSFPGPEYVEASIPSTATWRIIDRYRAGCEESSQGAQAFRFDDGLTNTLRLTGSLPNCSTGPAAVAFADGATAGTIRVSGNSAVSLGVVSTFDRGDAPASYGDAAHAVQYPFEGGAPPGSPTGVNTNVSEPFALATTTAPPTRLGPSVDPGGNPSPDALGDDDAGSGGAFGVDDDETEGPAMTFEFAPAGAQITDPAIACTGPGTVAGWIDFNANGTFDAAERSQSAPCVGTSVALTWTVPPDVQPQAQSFMRVRIAADAADVSSPTALAATGEVEDHLLVADPPETTISGGPDEGSTVPGGRPTFEFTSDEPGSTFECQIDDGPFEACVSGEPAGPLTPGQHTFSVRAVDPGGNIDPSPASRTFTVFAIPQVVTAEGTSIVTPPSFSGTVATFTFEGSDVSGVTATVDWGDGGSSPGTIAGPDADGVYSVVGTHAYATDGDYTATIRIRNAEGRIVTVTSSVLVFAPTGDGSGAFVIGDRTAAVGSTVTFWGAQWSKRNPLSGGAAPDAFKGYAAAFTGGRGPACGARWTTVPGNSAPPPSTIPRYMGVVVSAAMGRSGSAISGDVTRIVVDLPAPLGPSRPTHVPLGTSRSRPSTATMSP
jgi:hypothetical protein